MNDRSVIQEKQKEIEKLREIIDEKDLMIMELNIKLAVVEGKLDKIKNCLNALHESTLGLENW